MIICSPEGNDDSFSQTNQSLMYVLVLRTFISYIDIIYTNIWGIWTNFYILQILCLTCLNLIYRLICIDVDVHSWNSLISLSMYCCLFLYHYSLFSVWFFTLFFVSFFLLEQLEKSSTHVSIFIYLNMCTLIQLSYLFIFQVH